MKGQAFVFPTTHIRALAFCALSTATATAACAGAPAPNGTEAVGMDASLPLVLDSLLEHAIEADSVAPGVAIAVGRHGQIVHLQGYGRTDWDEEAPAVTDSTIYDLASLTKVVATTTAAMLLEESGALDLDRRVVDYVPEFSAPDKDPITLRMLLTHRSGMTTRLLHEEARGRDEYLEIFRAEPLSWDPGTEEGYSDWNIITLQFVIERVTGEPLDEFLDAQLFGPLAMRDTGYRPSEQRKPRIAPTENQEWRGGTVHGEVHDENSWALGGVAGHAGLFSSARDLAVFAQMMMNGGEHDGVRLLSPETIARWTAPQEYGSSRALGWDTPSEESSAGRYSSPRSFGHTGFTGTSIWMDPQADLFVVLLTNRVNPTRENTRIFPLRRAVADAVQQAVTDMPVRDWEAALGTTP